MLNYGHTNINNNTNNNNHATEWSMDAVLVGVLTAIVCCSVKTARMLQGYKMVQTSKRRQPAVE